MLLRDVFTEVQPLNLVLQKCVVSLCLADVPVYSNKSHTSLEKVFHFKTAFHLKKSRKNDKWCPNGNSIFATNFMSTWKKICYFPLMNLKKMFTFFFFFFNWDSLHARLNSHYEAWSYMKKKKKKKHKKAPSFHWIIYCWIKRSFSAIEFLAELCNQTIMVMRNLMC